MGRIVCVDTHVLIWGVKKDSSPSQREMIERTVNFLHWLENERQKIIVPAPVLGEFLMNIPQDQHDRITEEIQSRFMVLPYDAAAAAMFARIWQINKNNGMPSGESSREKMKIDSEIVAIAVINKAAIMYSEDPGLQKFANGFIETRDIPKLPRQLTFSE